MWILYILIFCALIFFAIICTIVSVFAGLVSGIVVTYVSVVRSCFGSIRYNVSNGLMRVLLSVILSLAVLITAAPVIITVVMAILSIFGVM